MIHAKILLIQQQIDEALSSLNLLLAEVEDSEYDAYASLIEQEMAETEKIITDWAKLGKVDDSIRKRIEATRIKRYIKEAMNYIN